MFELFRKVGYYDLVFLDDKMNVGRNRSRRSSGALLNSIKRKIEHIRRSVSSDRTGSRKLHRKTSSPAILKRQNDGVSEVTKCTLLQRFADESRLVQLRRRSTSDQFGIFIKVDSKGKGKKFLLLLL